ncbi:unnamed protein product [Microthlaspi erraticum]|uniref:Uncharacterized protein n=1 Tax=Microthlaspi erraticum TaxID=1685480 RepID=A0A6D2JN63_9BRAS|nr:unnamed protein product [Microthlaspi erraticum]
MKLSYTTINRNVEQTDTNSPIQLLEELADEDESTRGGDDGSGEGRTTIDDRIRDFRARKRVRRETWAVRLRSETFLTTG